LAGWVLSKERAQIVERAEGAVRGWGTGRFGGREIRFAQGEPLDAKFGSTGSPARFSFEGLTKKFQPALIA
jgi:hypothetical protein